MASYFQHNEVRIGGIPNAGALARAIVVNIGQLTNFLPSVIHKIYSTRQGLIKSTPTITWELAVSQFHTRQIPVTRATCNAQRGLQRARTSQNSIFLSTSHYYHHLKPSSMMSSTLAYGLNLNAPHHDQCPSLEMFRSCTAASETTLK